MVLGITQEQHPQRCRLFAQWKQLDWPILIDPINSMGCQAVPILVAIDEHGIVRNVRPSLETFDSDFIQKTFPPPDGNSKVIAPKATVPDLVDLQRLAKQANSADAWRRLGDALTLWGGVDRVDEAIAAYMRAVHLAPKDGDAHFRLGVCYRTRFDSPHRNTDDFQAAVDNWSRARSIRPNQYIWRRRIEQYGPRLIKPYSFYDWVKTAESEVTDRSERPIRLRVAPSGAEIAHPSRDFTSDPQPLEPPDPTDQIRHDTEGLIITEVTVVPPRIPPGGSARVHVALRPKSGGNVHWNNENAPLALWIEPREGWQTRRRLLTAPQGSRPETAEPRHLEFEVRAPSNASGTVKLPAYALYYVCEDAGGTCQFLRQDVTVIVKVGK